MKPVQRSSPRPFVYFKHFWREKEIGKTATDFVRETLHFFPCSNRWTFDPSAGVTFSRNQVSNGPPFAFAPRANGAKRFETFGPSAVVLFGCTQLSAAGDLQRQRPTPRKLYNLCLRRVYFGRGSHVIEAPLSLNSFSLQHRNLHFFNLHLARSLLMSTH